MNISYSSNFEHKNKVKQLVEQWQGPSSTMSLHSSGTSSKPKQIELSKELLSWSAQTTKKTFKLGHEKVLCCLPINKTGGFMQLIRALIHNWDIHFSKPSKSPLDQLEDNHSYSVISLTPYQLAHSMEQVNKLAQFKLILIGGAKISQRLVQDLRKHKNSFSNTQIVETYGMTETASHIAYKQLDEEWFKAVNGVTLSKVSECLHVFIKELNLDVQTTDIVELNSNRIKLIGRSDHVINSAGIKIYPSTIEPQIESLLNRCGIQRSFYLSKKQHEQWGEEAVLVLEGIPISNEAFVLELLYRELPAYHHPKSVVYVDQIQRTDTGKIKRQIF